MPFSSGARSGAAISAAQPRPRFGLSNVRSRVGGGGGAGEQPRAAGLFLRAQTQPVRPERAQHVSRLLSARRVRLVVLHRDRCRRDKHRAVSLFGWWTRVPPRRAAGVGALLCSRLCAIFEPAAGRVPRRSHPDRDRLIQSIIDPAFYLTFWVDPPPHARRCSR